MQEDALQALICRVTGASAARRLERLQSLWSGWGEIVRYALEGAELSSVVVKRVQPPQGGAHPRGWGSDLSTQRKHRSYRVEEHFYRRFAPQLEGGPRTARVLHLERGLFVFEDLDAAGFPGRRQGAGSLVRLRIHGTIAWLAGFHATFLGVAPEGLWPKGTYWHLETRPDELSAMPRGALRDAASAFDQRLNAARFQTLVHGDAKVANFCYGRTPEQVAAVDFQYVGGGVGVRDLAYFLGSVLDEPELSEQIDPWLDHYFGLLRRSLELRASTVDVDALEAEWRSLWPTCWADFERFLAGWAPGHWKRGPTAERLTRQALGEVSGG